MISLTRLLCDTRFLGDSLRYTSSTRGASQGVTREKGPVVVWNCTRACNLRCRHCYANSGASAHPDELTTEEAYSFIDDLADFAVPVILLSGGEPLLRPDILALAAYATQRKIRVAISTNGTLITPEVARRFKKAGVGYVGVSLDGMEENHDRLRGERGAFAAALRGIENCLARGQKVGVRFTINRHNYQDLDAIFDLIKEEKIPRVCFYHLVYSGRGSRMQEEDLTREESREALELMMGRTRDLFRQGREVEVLTVDNHADGAYLYLKLSSSEPLRADKVRQLLTLNGGNRSGVAIGEVDWKGEVHPDQFTLNHPLGNVREKSFKEIWTGEENPFLAALRNRKPLLKGRCRGCGWLDMCNGNFRARAEAATGDFWEADPACYLTEAELQRAF